MIMKKKNYPIRMCIGCRKREFQKNLIRFQIKNREIIIYSGSGRSSYLCSVCLKDKKKILYISKRFSIVLESFEKLLKELNING